MILGLIGLFLFFTCLMLGVFCAFQKKANRIQDRMIRRVKDFSKNAKKGRNDNIPFIIQDGQLSKIPFLNQVLEKLDVSKKLQRLLEQSGSSMKVGRLILLMLVFGGTGYLIGHLMHVIVLRFVLPLFFGSLPLIDVSMRRNKRLKAFIRGFPDTIDMMTSAIRAGHAFNQAMQLVGDEAPDPIGIEFKRTFEQYNLGLNLREALMNLTRRVDSLDLKLFVTAVLLQRETGGNLTEILEKISYTIRERFKLIGQIRTYTAQGRLSATILGSLPIAFIVIISALNPEYLKPLFKDRLGTILIVVSGFLQIIGFLIIRKIVRIKYQ